MYTIQMPKFLMVVGFFSKISLMAKICPTDFLTFLSLLRKYLETKLSQHVLNDTNQVKVTYQNLLLARTSFVDHSFMR